VVVRDDNWRQQPLDVQLLRAVCLVGRAVLLVLLNPDKYWRDHVRPFCVTLAGGRVSDQVEIERAIKCESSGAHGLPCESRRSIGPRVYCVAETCKCPKQWWWPFSQLAFKRRRRLWGCPLRRFRPERPWWRWRWLWRGVRRTRHRWPPAVHEMRRRWWRWKHPPRGSGCRRQQLSIDL